MKNPDSKISVVLTDGAAPTLQQSIAFFVLTSIYSVLPQPFQNCYVKRKTLLSQVTKL